MQYELNEAQAAFRSEVETFLAENLPADVARKVRRGEPLGKDALGAWTKPMESRQ